MNDGDVGVLAAVVLGGFALWNAAKKGLDAIEEPAKRWIYDPGAGTGAAEFTGEALFGFDNVYNRAAASATIGGYVRTADAFKEYIYDPGAGEGVVENWVRGLF